jgi:hypothetical protein
MNYFLLGILLTDEQTIGNCKDYLIDDASRHHAAKSFLPELPREAAWTHMGL